MNNEFFETLYNRLTMKSIEYGVDFAKKGIMPFTSLYDERINNIWETAFEWFPEFKKWVEGKHE